MAINPRASAHYPSSIWDGSTPSRPGDGASPRLTHRPPDADDWDQAVAEIIALQEQVEDLKATSTTTRLGLELATSSTPFNVFRNTGDSHYADIADMAVEIGLEHEGDLLVTFEALCQPEIVSAPRALQFQFSLDGQVFSPDDLVTYSGAGPLHGEKQKYTVSFVFRDVPAGQHTIRARASNAGSGQSWDILNRRLTVMF